MGVHEGLPDPFAEEPDALLGHGPSVAIELFLCLQHPVRGDAQRGELDRGTGQHRRGELEPAIGEPGDCSEVFQPQQAGLVEIGAQPGGQHLGTDDLHGLRLPGMEQGAQDVQARRGEAGRSLCQHPLRRGEGVPGREHLAERRESSDVLSPGTPGPFPADVSVLGLVVALLGGIVAGALAHPPRSMADRAPIGIANPLR